MPASNMDDGSDSLSFIELVTMKTYTCARCATFKPKESVTFTKRAALMHLIDAHPHKLVDSLCDQVSGLHTSLEIDFLFDDSHRHKGG